MNYETKQNYQIWRFKVFMGVTLFLVSKNNHITVLLLTREIL